MKEYRSLIIKTIIIIILIVTAVLLNKNHEYIPEGELPINSYYTEDEIDYEELYIEKTLNTFMACLNEKDYNTAYDLLTKECKNKRFKEASEFGKYFKENYPEYVELESNEKLFFTFYDYSELDTMDSTKKITILIGKQRDDKSIYEENDIPEIKVILVINGPYDMKIEI